MRLRSKLIVVCVITAAVVVAAAVFVVLLSEKEGGFCCGAEMVAVGGIAPHHDLANLMIDEFYRELSSQKGDIQTFIILSPNHANAGSAPVITGSRDWPTKQGAVIVDAELQKQLKMLGFVGEDEKNIAAEHGISVHLPFIKQYFPEARIVPLAFSTRLRTFESFELAQRVKMILQNQNTFLIASLDFSHYLPLAAAQVKDAETMAAMKNFDYDKIASFGSDNVDSPQALITFLRAMELADAKNITESAHKNSSDFLAGQVENVTTYFYWWFGK